MMRRDNIIQINWLRTYYIYEFRPNVSNGLSFSGHFAIKMYVTSCLGTLEIGQIPKMHS